MFKKGYKPSEKHKANLKKSIRERIARLGYRYTKKQRENWSKVMKEKGIVPSSIGWNKGLKQTEETNEKRREWNKNNPEKIANRKGKKHSDKTKKLMSESRSGEKAYQWISDRTLLKDDHRERGGQLHGEWSRNVKNRDKQVCRIATVNCDGRLEAHHILSWKDFPELRYELNNGITLCHAHHPRKRVDEAKLSPYFQSLVAEM